MYKCFKDYHINHKIKIIDKLIKVLIINIYIMINIKIINN